MGTEDQGGGTNNTAIKAGAAAIVVILLGFLWQSGALKGPEEPEAEPTKLAAVEPSQGSAAAPTVTEPAAKAAEAVAPAADPVQPAADESTVSAEKPAEEKLAEAPTAAAVAPVVPSFDVSRIAPDGQSLVAGRAEPGSTVQILLDGKVVSETVVGPDGAFTALFSLGANAAASLLSLQTVMPDGTIVVSDQTVAVAPIAGPDGAPNAEPPAAILVTEQGVTVLEGADAEVADNAAPAVAEQASAAEAVQSAEAKPEPSVPAEPAEKLALADQAEPTAQRGATPNPDSAAQDTAATPSKPATQVSLQAIGYSPSGDVMLSGRGEAGQLVRLYLDNQPKADTTVGPEGVWQMTLADVTPGVFTLRVDQLDDTGKVTARFETPFKRETREALAALANPTVPAQTQEAPAPEPAAPTPAVESAPPAAGAVAAVEQPATAVEQKPSTEVEAPQTTAQVEAPAAQAAPSPKEEVPAVAPASDVPVTKEAEAPAQPAQGEPAPSLPVGGVSVTVQPGFTLWAIARDTYGDGLMYVQVYKANKDKIRDPNLIYPGQVFVVPSK